MSSPRACGDFGTGQKNAIPENQRRMVTSATIHIIAPVSMNLTVKCNETKTKFEVVGAKTLALAHSRELITRDSVIPTHDRIIDRGIRYVRKSGTTARLRKLNNGNQCYGS